MAVEWKGEALSAVLGRATMRGIMRGTEEVRELANERINSGPKSGRIYRRRGVEHQASAPDEAPAADTGRLTQSADTQYDHVGLIGRVTWHTSYAAALEFGTQRIEPRPFARPALAGKIDAIQEDVANEISAVLREGPV